MSHAETTGQDDSSDVGVKRILKAQIDMIDLMASKSRQVIVHKSLEQN